MKDKAGIDIAVGCRVAEADFGYGDGTVESITVPSRGGGFTVGVHWDDPEKNGPGWSAEGGGRGAEHLLVIEAEAERPERERLTAHLVVDEAASTEEVTVEEIVDITEEVLSM